MDTLKLQWYPAGTALGLSDADEFRRSQILRVFRDEVSI